MELMGTALHAQTPQQPLISPHRTLSRRDGACANLGQHKQHLQFRQLRQLPHCGWNGVGDGVPGYIAARPNPSSHRTALSLQARRARARTLGNTKNNTYNDCISVISPTSVGMGPAMALPETELHAQTPRQPLFSPHRTLSRRDGRVRELGGNTKTTLTISSTSSAPPLWWEWSW